MSENWVLVPEEAAPQMIEADLGYYQGGRTEDEQIVAESYKLMLAARPPVSREWLDAAVKRAGKSMAHHIHKDGDWGIRGEDAYEYEPEYFDGAARAAILAALEMTDEP